MELPSAATATKWTIPMPSMNNGWYEVPLWVAHGKAVSYPRDAYTLVDGTIARGGDTLTTNKAGITILASRRSMTALSALNPPEKPHDAS